MCVVVEFVRVLGSVQVLGLVQECAVCVQERAPAGLGAGSFESARRDKRESVRGVRREALRGGAGGVGESDDDEDVYLHGFDEKSFFSQGVTYSQVPTGR